MLKNASVNVDLQALLKFSAKCNLEINLKEILNNHSYMALVLTDETQKILWVNNGFSEMTGYSKSFAINRTPGFLQGKNTSEEVKSRIRKKVEKKNHLRKY
ncbi:MAG: PAS domain S-box protein [Chloroflexia bacterium]|nr:PAS domain S-box protein [Chloroflexia bacterium]